MVKGNWVHLQGERVVNEGRKMGESNQVQLQARRVISEGRNVVKGNQVQVQADVLTAQARMKSAKKQGLAARWKVISANAETWSKETGFGCKLKESSEKAGMEATKKSGPAVGGKVGNCRGLESSTASEIRIG